MSAGTFRAGAAMADLMPGRILPSYNGTPIRHTAICTNKNKMLTFDKK